MRSDYPPVLDVNVDGGMFKVEKSKQ
jgi:hypothetical protein